VSSLGGFASGAVGANWQSGNNVVGFQGDMQWSNESAAAITDCGLGCSLNDRVRVPWLATLRARAGKAFDRLYVYGTGGIATSGSSDNLNSGGIGSTPNFANLAPNNVDWTIGGGMELALDHNVTAKIEYLHNSPTGAPVSLFESTVNDTMKNDIVRGGIDYRLPIDSW
jgi:outer membrane immunogenic protein